MSAGEVFIKIGSFIVFVIKVVAKKNSINALGILFPIQPALSSLSMFGLFKSSF